MDYSQKIEKIKEELLILEAQMLEEKGIVPYEMGYAIKNLTECVDFANKHFN